MTFANEIVGFASVVLAVFAVTVDTNYILCFEPERTPRVPSASYTVHYRAHMTFVSHDFKSKKNVTHVTLFFNSVSRCVMELRSGVTSESEKILHDEAIQRR